MRYDLVRLFDHPLRFRNFIPSAIVTFGGAVDAGQCDIEVEWRNTASVPTETGTLTLSWDVDTLRPQAGHAHYEPLTA